MTDLTTLARITLALDDERKREKPSAAVIQCCESYLRSFAPKAAHDYVTCSQPPEKED